MKVFFHEMLSLCSYEKPSWKNFYLVISAKYSLKQLATQKIKELK